MVPSEGAKRQHLEREHDALVPLRRRGVPRGVRDHAVLRRRLARRVPRQARRAREARAAQRRGRRDQGLQSGVRRAIRVLGARPPRAHHRGELGAPLQSRSTLEPSAALRHAHRRADRPRAHRVVLRAPPPPHGRARRAVRPRGATRRRWRVCAARAVPRRRVQEGDLEQRVDRGRRGATAARVRALDVPRQLRAPHDRRLARRAHGGRLQIDRCERSARRSRARAN